MPSVRKSIPFAASRLTEKNSINGRVAGCRPLAKAFQCLDHLGTDAMFLWKQRAIAHEGGLQGAVAEMPGWTTWLYSLK